MLEIDKKNVFHSGIDYKTLELKNCSFEKLEALFYSNLLYLKNMDLSIHNCIETETFYIFKTRERGVNSGFNIYWIYTKKMRKLGQIKHFRNPDLRHKNVVEFRGLFCHYYNSKTMEILEVLWIENEYKLNVLHIDYCMDLLDTSVSDIIKHIDFKKYNLVDMKVCNWKIESVYIDLADKRVRIYNKIKEISEVGKKDKEYKEYMRLWKDVTRIEVAYKSTREWVNRTYGAVIKRIEGIFGDSLAQYFWCTNFWASVKKKLNVIIEKEENIIETIIEKEEDLLSKVEFINEKVKKHTKQIKTAIENIEFLMGYENYELFRKYYRIIDFRSLDKVMVWLNELVWFKYIELNVNLTK